MDQTLLSPASIVGRIAVLCHSFIALHIAAARPSPYVLERILSYPDCDVDPTNRLEGSTPLHLAARIKDAEARFHIVESLLEAGADTR